MYKRITSVLLVALFVFLYIPASLAEQETLLVPNHLFDAFDFEQTLNDDCFTKDANGTAVENADPWTVFPATTGINLVSGYASGTTGASIVEDADKGKVLKLSAGSWVNNGLRLTIPYTAPDLTSSTMYVEYDVKMSKVGGNVALGDMLAFTGTQWSNALPRMRNAGTGSINIHTVNATEYESPYGFIDEWMHIKMVINKSTTEGKALKYSIHITNSSNQTTSYENIELANALNNALSIQFFQGDVYLDNIQAYTISEFGIESVSDALSHKQDKPYKIKLNNYVDDNYLTGVVVKKDNVAVEGATCTLDTDGQTLVFNAVWEYEATYEITLSGVKDIFGAELPEMVKTFTVEVYNPPPQISLSSAGLLKGFTSKTPITYLSDANGGTVWCSFAISYDETYDFDGVVLAALYDDGGNILFSTSIEKTFTPGTYVDDVLLGFKIKPEYANSELKVSIFDKDDPTESICSELCFSWDNQ